MSMSEITNQLTQLADEIAVLTKLRRETFSKAIMAQFAGTNVKSVMFFIYTDADDSDRILVRIDANVEVIKPEDVSWVDEDLKSGKDQYIFQVNDDTIDIMEHGNAGAQLFLTLGIEVKLWDQIGAEIRNNSNYLAFMFDLTPNDSALVITDEGWWVDRSPDYEF